MRLIIVILPSHLYPSFVQERPYYWIESRSPPGLNLPAMEPAVESLLRSCILGAPPAFLFRLVASAAFSAPWWQIALALGACGVLVVFQQFCRTISPKN